MSYTRNIENHFPLVTAIRKSSVSVEEVKYILKTKLTSYKHHNYKNKQTSKQSSLISTDTSATVHQQCNHCRKDHKLFACEMFLKLSVRDMINKVRDLGLCLNCKCSNYSSI